MIIQPGQFKLRLQGLQDAYDLSDIDLRKVVAIEFDQVHPRLPEMTYTTRLTRSGKSENAEPLRFIRKRTKVTLLDGDDAALWSNRGGVPEPEADSAS